MERGSNLVLKRLQDDFPSLRERINLRLVPPDDYISKRKKALRIIGAYESKHLHSLRHIFAVRRLIQGTSIYV